MRLMFCQTASKIGYFIYYPKYILVINKVKKMSNLSAVLNYS